MATFDLSAFRKQLHKHPELSGQEVKTAKIVVQTLEQFNPEDMITNLGGTGVAAIFDSGNPGTTTMFRSELDALPIQESNTFQHKSITDNVSHKCGHDGHSTILIGLAEQLSANPPSKGRVILLFQPAEETGEGAKAILNDDKFNALKPDFIFALHNVPGFKKGVIVCKDKAFTPSVISFVLKLKGKTSHAAEPEHGINPDMALQELIYRIKQLDNANMDADDYATIATVYATLGSKDYGISAGYAELHMTIRTWTPEQLAQLKNTICGIIEEVTKAKKLQYDLDWIDEFTANINNSEAVEYIKQAAHIMGYTYHSKPHPFKWGEDFGLFTQHFKGAMFGLGSGENTPALHNPDYDFPEDIIPYGVNMFHAIIKQIHA